jgi:hypothetical protein
MAATLPAAIAPDQEPVQAAPPPAPAWVELDPLPGEAEAVQRNPAMSTLLALFMILLGFFVILSTHSKTERARVAAASGSLAAALGKVTGGVPDAPRAEPVRRVFENGLAAQGLSLRSLTSRDRGAEGGFAAPVDDIFAVARAGLTGNGDAIMRLVAQVLTASPEGSGTGVEVLLPNDTGAGGFAAHRAAALGRRFIELGVPVAAFSVGILPSTRGDVQLVFAARPGAGG